MPASKSNKFNSKFEFHVLARQSTQILCFFSRDAGAPTKHKNLYDCFSLKMTAKKKKKN